MLLRSIWQSATPLCINFYILIYLILVTSVLIMCNDLKKKNLFNIFKKKKTELFKRLITNEGSFTPRHQQGCTNPSKILVWPHNYTNQISFENVILHRCLLVFMRRRSSHRRCSVRKGVLKLALHYPYNWNQLVVRHN